VPLVADSNLVVYGRGKMSVVLQTGANGPLTESVVNLSIDSRGAGSSDACLLFVEESGKVGEEADFLFYNQPQHPSGAATLTPPDKISVDLSRVPSRVEKIVIAAANDTPFTTSPSLAVSTSSGVVYTYDVPQVNGESCLVVAELYRRANVWKIRAVGQGYTTGLAGLATDFGIAIGDDEPAAAAAPPTASATHSSLPPSAPSYGAAPSAPQQGTGASLPPSAPSYGSSPPTYFDELPQSGAAPSAPQQGTGASLPPSAPSYGAAPVSSQPQNSVDLKKQKLV
jgi:stress response protein SCP2